MKTMGGVVLIALSILFRTVWHVGPNIEFVTTATLLSSVYLGPRFALIIPLVSIAISDMIIGNTSIYLFTWSAYIMIGLVFMRMRACRFTQYSRVRQWVIFLGSGCGAGVWFYLWTNFGVWYLDDWNMYADGIDGLGASYRAGLPFLRYTLLGNTVFTTIAFWSIELVHMCLLVKTPRNMRGFMGVIVKDILLLHN